MLGMGVKPKLSNEGYEKASILKTVQDQSVDQSPGAVCFVVVLKFNSLVYRYKGLGKPAHVLSNQIIHEELCFVLEF